MRKEDHCHGELDPTVNSSGLIVYPETRTPLRSAVWQTDWPSAHVRNVIFRHA